MDELVGEHDKLNIPDTERQILPHITYMWNLRHLNLKKQRTECWLPGSGGNG